MAELPYNDQNAKQLLRELGIHPFYRGYQITLLALECIAESEECLTALKKEIYLPVSEKLGCNYATVEVAIRRTSERAWKSNPDLVCRIAFQQLDRRPQARRFLESLYRACCEEPGCAKGTGCANGRCCTQRLRARGVASLDCL